MNEPIEDFKTRFNKAISIRDIKPAELAEKTNLSKSTISHYMSGYTKPKSDKLFILSKALKVNESWLLGLNVPMETSNTILSSDLNKIFEKLSTEMGIDKNELVSKFLNTDFSNLPTEQLEINETNIRNCLKLIYQKNNKTPSFNNKKSPTDYMVCLPNGSQVIIESDDPSKAAEAKRLLAYYFSLSEMGQKKALDNIEDLAKIYVNKQNEYDYTSITSRFKVAEEEAAYMTTTRNNNMEEKED